MLALDGGHTRVVTSLAYAPHGGLLVSGGRDGAVCLWDPLAGKLLRRCRTDWLGAPVSSVAVSPSGGLVAAGCANGEACALFAVTGDVYRHFRAERRRSTGAPAFVAFRPFGLRLVMACGLEIADWDVDSVRRERRLTMPEYSSVTAFTSLACSSDGRIGAGYFNGATIWTSSADSSENAAHWPAGDVVSLAFAPDSPTFATARGRDVGLWQRPLGPGHGYSARLVRRLRHTEQVRACAFTPDVRTLISAGDDWTVHLWDIATGHERRSFNFRLGPVVALAVAPDGMTAAVSGRDKPGIVLFDLE